MTPGSTNDDSVARLGAVSFLNTRPLVDGLDDDPRVELHYAVPSALPGLLAEGLVDAALIPVIDLARNADKWERVSDSCIGSDGRTLTVRVFSKVPPERMEVLRVDSDSHTSVALARLIWGHVYRRPLQLEPMVPAEDLRDCESVLLIGDKVATTPMLWFDYHVDLGDAWKKWTGLPFVFAVWARKKEGRGDAGTRRCGDKLSIDGDPIARVLECARDSGTARAAEIGAEYGPKRGWPTALAVEYLTRALMFKLTPAALAGMNRYFELLVEAELVPYRNQDVVMT
jgi:chorismate dehydratase